MKTFLIAEIAQAHGGSIDRAYEYIDALATTGIDAVKFQTHIAQAESSIQEPFRVKFTDKYKTRYDYWKAMEFTVEEWCAIKSRCEANNMEFMSSPFSNAAVDLLEKVGVDRYKIGSGEVNNFLLLEKVARTGKPVILSSGMSSLEELDGSIAFLEKRQIPITLLQCTTSYPTLPHQYGLNVIGELKKRYGHPVGFSDHSAQISTLIAAAAQGAEVLEFHAVLDRENDKGPDAKSSLEIAEISQLVDAVKKLDISRQNPIDKTDNSSFAELKSIFEKSLAINRELEVGHVLTFEDLEAKKPKGYGIPADKFEKVLGKPLSCRKRAWDFLNWQDINL